MKDDILDRRQCRSEELSKMKFMALSRRTVEQCNNVDSPHVIISITSPALPQAELVENEYTVNVHRLSFDDLDAAPSPGTEIALGGAVLFDETMAKSVADFVRRWDKHIDTVVCHCELGVSRSAGMAAALAKHYTGDDSAFFEPPGMYNNQVRFVPNMRVYRKVLQALETEA